jgi:hypothetical protein
LVVDRAGALYTRCRQNVQPGARVGVKQDIGRVLTPCISAVDERLDHGGRECLGVDL